MSCPDLPPEALNEPDVVWLGKRQYLMREEFRYFDTLNGWEIRIPRGFRCDLASIPRALWSFIDPSDLGEKAAVVHDWIYFNTGEVVWVGEAPSSIFRYSRGQSDDLFRRIMVEQDIDTAKRRAAYTAVRACGWKAWRDAKRNLAQPQSWCGR